MERFFCGFGYDNLGNMEKNKIFRNLKKIEQNVEFYGMID